MKRHQRTIRLATNAGPFVVFEVLLSASIGSIALGLDLLTKSSAVTLGQAAGMWLLVHAIILGTGALVLGASSGEKK